MTDLLACRATVLAVREHSRTIHGRRDPATGAAVTEQVNLGYFLHLDFGSGGGPIAFGIGPDRPEGIVEGEAVVVRISRE